MTDQTEHQCKPGATVYYCPTSGETESDCHGGFDQCCDRPDLHRPVSTAWTPPPPGDRREQLPDEAESFIVCTTACDEQHTYDWTCALFTGVDDSGPADLTPAEDATPSAGS
jgi:hypothetical protein